MPLTLTDLLEQKVERQRADEENKRQALRQFYYSRINDQNTDPQVREQLSQDYLKLLTPEAKKHAQHGLGVLGKLRDLVGKIRSQQQPVQGAPQQPPGPIKAPTSNSPQSAQPQARPVVAGPSAAQSSPPNPQATPQQPQFFKNYGQALIQQHEKEVADELKQRIAAQSTEQATERKQKIQELKGLNLPPEQLRQAILDVYGVKQTAKNPVQEKLDAVDADQKRGKLTPEEAREARLKAYGIEQPEKMPADLSERIEARKIIDNPKSSKEEVEGARDALKKLATQEQAAQVRISIAGQNAAANNTPANPAVTDYWSKFFAGGGKIDYGFLRNLGKRQIADIMAAVPAIAAQNGETPGEMLARQSDVKSLEGALTVMQKQTALITAYEKTADQNLDRAISALSKIADTGSPIFNRPVRAVEDELLGKPQYAAFHAARQAASTEIAKVLSGSMGNGAVSDTQQAEARKTLSDNATLEQMMAAAKTLKAEMASRLANNRDTIESIKKQISGPTGGNTPKSAPSGKGGTAKTADEYLKSNGYQ